MGRFLCGILAILTTIAGVVIIEGGSVLAYLGFTPFIITFFIPIFATLAVWEFKTIGQAWMNAFTPNPNAEDRATSRALWDFFEKTCYSGGFIAFVLGIILVLSTVRDLEHLGEPLSVCFIAPMYAVFLAITARILKARVEMSNR